MSFFSRMFKRSGVSSSSRRARRPGARVLGVEPLEERRLLAIDAPLDFNVQHVPGPLGEEIEIKFSQDQFEELEKLFLTLGFLFLAISLLKDKP